MNSYNPENAYLTLVSLAEEFRTQKPPDIRNCVQCLTAIINLRVPYPAIEAKTHLQIGSLLLEHSNNLELAKVHLKKAWGQAETIANCEDIIYESISLLARIYEKMNHTLGAKEILLKGVEKSCHSIYWHIKLLFQLAQIHANDQEYNEAANVLNIGAEYANISGAHYTRILFLLSRGMVLMIDKRINEVHPVLNLAGQLVESWQGNVHLKEALKVFFLVLQVCHHLNAGQVKSVRPSLKLLQQSIQNITATSFHLDDEYMSLNSNDTFIWMPKEHMCVLVYLVTVLHSMQSGYMEKAQKYTEKALMQIDKLRSVGSHQMLNTFQLILLEHIAMCRLVMGNRTLAIKEIVQALNICYRDTKLKFRHKPLIHSLLGMYAMSMNITDCAESQLRLSLTLHGASNEARILTSLNLAIVYLRNKRENELNELLVNLNPESLHSNSQSLKAAAYYVFGLNSYFQARYNDAKRYLRETLKMANGEDLNRLTSCSLVLLGHIFYSLGNSRESLNMVTPAMQLASKIPDTQVQLWATALLKDLYDSGSAKQAEAIQMHNQFSQILLNDQYQALHLNEHGYINWYSEH
ncbi:mau2 sister chromatid cohesion factor [Dermatophagoides farinae]|uniref:MAU2 chromatid cohesion factor homolog n=1 Tax=Dermatophagoides farinae TaxID=6954 RepID=A0A9D4P455_DERFA|nr:MAU2 chromatid cohesion factor homolog [Dermatophagoides farinae]XP_046912904.1 MAU2 chromatid cohesion factor homolog [Dermatophagoides farinae]KAH7643712.1 mau2 chromatid cohesion factor [Dermatophagoides farinae]